MFLCANIGSDQPGQMPRLIRAFVWRTAFLLAHFILIYLIEVTYIANSLDLDGKPVSVTSHLGLLCL